MIGFTRPTKRKEIIRKWHLVNVDGEILGRVATRIAQFLIGKSKPYFVQYLDCGDFVVVINAKKVKVTGKKREQKFYLKYSGYPGGLKKKTFAQVMDENPSRIIKEAVSGMLPKNKLRKKRLKRLYIFSDQRHPFESKVKMKEEVNEYK